MMSFQKKTLLITGITFLCLSLVLGVVLCTWLVSSFDRLEDEDLRENVTRAANALQDECRGFNVVAHEWAVWDDMHQFATDRNEAFERSNLVESAFASVGGVGLNLLAIYNRAGQEVYGIGFDPRENVITPLPKDFAEFVAAHPRLKHHADASEGQIGFVVLSDGIVMLSSRQILPGNGEGPSSGTQIMGRYLDEDAVAALSRRTQLTLHVQTGAALPNDDPAAKTAYAQLVEDAASPDHDGPLFAVHETSNTHITGYTLIPDMQHGGGLLLTVERPRGIFAQGRQTAFYLLVILGIFAVVTTGTILIVIRHVTSPLKKTISNLLDSVSYVRSAAQAFADTSGSLLGGAEQQASALRQTNASLQEMADAIDKNAHTASMATQLANETQRVAQTGQQAVAEMNRAIEEIQHRATETAKIVKAIDEIAFQTNLLALNAAVEAARAGDSGKGFAVVAEEVRSLAQRSAQAARNTADMIQASLASAANGAKIEADVTRTLEHIHASATKVNALISEIATSSSEQAHGIGQVNSAVEQIDQVANQSMTHAKESAHASEALAQQAQSLQDDIDELRSLVGKAA